MALDDSVADRRRFALLLGLVDGRGAGLPVGPSDDRRRRGLYGGHVGLPGGVDGRPERIGGDATDGGVDRSPADRNGDDSPA